MRKRVLICGCGYVGLETGRRLRARGHEVFGLRRTEAGFSELEAAGIIPLRGDLTRLADLDGLPGPFDWVINTVSSTRGGTAEYREVYLGGIRNLVQWLRDPAVRLVYTSSTGVYGQTDGNWVDESSPTVPGTETGQVLVETEQELVRPDNRFRLEAMILRVAGIYGPGRGHLFREFLQGNARLHGNGLRWLNMIHRDDVAEAVITTLERGHAGQIYNAVDNKPVNQRDFLGWFAAQLNRPLPPPAEEAELARRKRGTTSKRVSNRRLREELGWAPIYPDFRTGYAADVAVLRA